jgi:hypothetical protein
VIPHFDEHISIHERQLEALSSRVSEHTEFVNETGSAFLDLKSELTLKCEEPIRDIGIMNSTANASVAAQCDDLLSQLYVEIENVKSWTSSELSSKLGDLHSQIDGEIEKVKLFTTSKPSSKCGDLHSCIDGEIGNLKSWISSEVKAQYGSFRSDIDGEIGNLKSFTTSELSSKCGDLRSRIDREIGNLKSWMSSEVEARYGNDFGELRATVTELQERFRQIESSTTTLTSCAGSSALPTHIASANSVPCSTPRASSNDPDWSPSASAPLDAELCAGLPVRFAISDDKPLTGIVSYLSRKHGGNIHEKGIVTLTSSSVVDNHPGYSPKNLADPQIRA